MGASANGIYSVSYKFPNMIETVYHYFYLAWSESASRVVAEGKKAAQRYYQSLYNMLDNMIFSVVLFIIAAMAILFRIFVRGDYLQGFDYIPILTLSMYFNSMGKFYSGIYTALKKTRSLATSTAIGALVNIVVNVVLINYWGLYAAAVSTLVAEIAVCVIRHLQLAKDVKIKISLPGTLLKIVMAVAVCLLYSYDNWFKVILGIVLVAVYSVIVNKKVILSMILKLKSKISKA